MSTSVSFSMLWPFYTTLFLMVFCDWYGSPKLWPTKGTAKARDIAWEFMEHTALRPDELSVKLSLQLFCYCNFSSLPLPPMLLLSCGSALMVITFNCTQRKKKKRKKDKEKQLKQLHFLKLVTLPHVSSHWKKCVLSVWTCSSHDYIGSITGISVKIIVKISYCGLSCWSNNTPIRLTSNKIHCTALGMHKV